MAVSPGIRHAWSFDDMFSTFATQGLESKEKGKFTREELAPLAKVNVESLKEFGYFTFATADGKKAELDRSRAGLLARLQRPGLDAQFLAAIQDAGEGQRAEESKSTIPLFSSTSHLRRTNRYSLPVRRTASSTLCCRVK